LPRKVISFREMRQFSTAGKPLESSGEKVRPQLRRGKMPISVIR